MGLLKIITGLLTPLKGIIDETITNKEERGRIQKQLIEIEAKVMSDAVAYEGKLLEAKQKIIVAEAKGEGWLQRSWRPLTMITFLVLIVMDTMGYTEFRLSSEAWEVLKYGISGYVIGRTAEKTGITKHIGAAVEGLVKRRKR